MKSDTILECCRTYKREIELSRDALAQFLNQKYINLETYKKSGQAVHTPVWFVQDNGVLYVRTDKEFRQSETCAEQSACAHNAM